MKYVYSLPGLLALMCGLACNVAVAQCPVTAGCTPGSASNPNASSFGMGIFNVTLGTINNTTPGVTDGYQNYSCTQGTTLSPGLAYPISIRTNANANENVRVWVDFNNNGSFDPVSELFFSSDNARLHTGNTAVVPAAAVLGQPLRLRVSADYINAPVPTPCSTPQYSQVEDYRVTLQPNTLPPAAAFTVDLAQACAGTFAFRDQSTRGATSWLWRFGDGTTSTQQNPTHTYSSPGSRQVTLRACNAFGCDSSTVPLSPAPITFFAQNPAAVLRQPQTLTYCCGYGLTRVELGQDPALNGRGLIAQSSADGSAGYQDFACVQRLTIAQAAPFALRLTGTLGVAQVFRVFIDSNNNGVFTANEQIWTQAGSDQVATFITLPGNLPTNQPLRLRITADSNDGSADPEADRTRGQVEDYSLVVTPAPCVAPVRAGQIVTVQQGASPNSNQDRAVFTVVGASSNATFQWQRSPTGTSPVWTDIPGATQRHLTVDETVGATGLYRVNVTCGTTTATPAFTAALTTPAPYRLHGLCVNGSQVIQRVALLGTELNSESGCSNAQGESYSLYDPLEPGRSATLYRGEAYELRVTTLAAARVTVFGTWYRGSQPSGSMRPLRVNTTAGVPASLLLDLDSVRSLLPNGSTSSVLRLRVRCDSDVNNPTIPGETNMLTFGETEDYVLPVLPRSCLTPTNGVLGGLVSGPQTPQCPTEPLALSLSGHTPGAPLQWQVSADSVTWQDVAGQTGRVLQLSSTLAGLYRVRVQGCATTAYSVPFRVRARAAQTCYCAPSAATAPAAAPRFARVVLRGTTLDNSSSAGAGPAYTAYPADTPARTATLVRGATYAAELTLATTAGSPVTASAWLDIDQNGRYDSLEWVHLTRVATPTTGTATYVVELPISAQTQLGAVGLRLRVTAGAPWRASQACASPTSLPNGETEDYTLNIMAAPCATAGNPLTAGTIEWPQPATCVTLLRSRTYSLGAELQWQQSTDQGATWTSIAGATSDLLPLPEDTRSATVRYRLRAQCGSAVAYAPAVTVPAGSCQFSCLNDNQMASGYPQLAIDDVALTGTTLANYGSGLNYNPLPPRAPHLRRSPTIPNFTGTLVQGGTHTLQITTVGSLSDMSNGAWIDWNHDNTLSAGEFLGGTLVPTGRTTTSLPVSVPANAVPGPTLLRVALGTGGPFLATYGCLTAANYYGETEDYLLTVVAQPGPVLPTLSASLCAGAPLQLEASGAGSGATYAWLGPNGFTATGATATVTGFSPAMAGTYVALAERNGQRVATSIFVPTAPTCLPLATHGPLVAARLGIYPNPTTDQSTVSWPEHLRATQLRVRNLAGQVLIEQSVAATNRAETVLNLRSYPAGLYVVELQTQQGSLFAKLVRQ